MTRLPRRCTSTCEARTRSRKSTLHPIRGWAHTPWTSTMGATRILTPTAIGVLVAVQARASARTLTRRCFEPGLVCCLSSELPRLMAGQRNATSTRRTRTASLRAPRAHLKEEGSPHVRGCSRSCCGVCDEAWPGCVTPNTWTSCPPSHPDTSSATTARADSANVRFVCACDAERNAKLIT
jgi:hypothetical protein